MVNKSKNPTNSYMYIEWTKASIAPPTNLYPFLLNTDKIINVEVQSATEIHIHYMKEYGSTNPYIVLEYSATPTNTEMFNTAVSLQSAIIESQQNPNVRWDANKLMATDTLSNITVNY